jgi:transposase
MARVATTVTVTDEEREELERRLRSPKTEQRHAFRARVVLAAAAGEGSASIARREGVRINTVSTWRTRFAAKGLAGLEDERRSGRPTVYGPETEARVLAVLEQPSPEGYSSWSGRLVAAALGDVPAARVWAILQKHGVQPQRRRSWCLSRDPEFAAKAAEIVALYLDPPENAVVLAVDEKPHIQALERAQGYLRLPNGRAVRGVSHEYKRHGTTTLFAALNVLTGSVHGMHAQRRRRREFLAFMNEVVADYPGQEMAGASSERALPLHADARELAEPGRDMVQHPQPPGVAALELSLAPRGPRPYRCLHPRLQPRRPSLRLARHARAFGPSSPIDRGLT